MGKKAVREEVRTPDVMKVSLIAWGLGGVYYHGIHGGNETSVSVPEYATPWLQHLADGYYQSDEWIGRGGTPTDFAGAWVLDKTAVLEKNARLAYDAPMHNVLLGKRSLSVWNGPQLDVGTIQEATPLSYVGTELYVEWWRKAGARVGRVSDDGRTVGWETPGIKLLSGRIIGHRRMYNGAQETVNADGSRAVFTEDEHREYEQLRKTLKE